MTQWFYRYTSDTDEQDDFSDYRRIAADSNQTQRLTTWATPRYDDSDIDEAKQDLGLPNEPEKRYGPLPKAQFPKPQSSPTAIQPCNGNVCGKAVEIEIDEPMFIPGHYSMDSGDWEGI